MYGTLISVTLEETFWAVVLLNCSSVNGFHQFCTCKVKAIQWNNRTVYHVHKQFALTTPNYSLFQYKKILSCLSLQNNVHLFHKNYGRSMSLDICWKKALRCWAIIIILYSMTRMPWKCSHQRAKKYCILGNT